MRKLFLAAALLALALATPAPAQTAVPAGQQAAVSSATKQFVDKAAMTDMFEIQAGQIAEQKSTNAAYKDFAQMTIDDHTKTTGQIKSMLPKLPGVQPPQQLDKQHQALLDKLNASSGTTFERMYKTDQVKGHREAIAMFERYAKRGDNPDLKKWAADTLPTLRTHLQHAQALPGSGPAPTVGSGAHRGGTHR
jgi:putative membrane protein